MADTPVDLPAPDDQETTDLEADLLGDTGVSGTNDVEPNAAVEPDVNTTEPKSQENDEDPIKVIQKLTGKLSQKIRDAEEVLTDKDIKYTLNSIISATNIAKLTDEDKADVINKIEDKDADAEVETTSNEPMAENDTAYEGDDDNGSEFYEKIFNDKTVNHIIDMADLNYEASNDPSDLAFDFCEAAYIFIQNYNDNHEFITKLKSILNDNQFKARPTLKSTDDLEYFGDLIYDAMVTHINKHNGEVLEQDNTIARFTASGGQTVGENKLNEQILSILEKARQNVKNKLNN